ncbi:hypothetical protein JK159_02450 [Weissella minor]|uniref:hypothetical protein n=1 Tax=Weissella minor TaxID=1620 RepID=UPI001BAFCF80|nr:hypothetical protein [Weissella minor]MBS0949244.1 hypothetical protein [Weissella minor]
MKSNQHYEQMLASLEEKEWRDPAEKKEYITEVSMFQDWKKTDDYRYWLAQLGHILCNQFHLSMREAAKQINLVPYQRFRRSMKLYPQQDFSNFSELKKGLMETQEGS